MHEKKAVLSVACTRLKNKIGSNLTWEGVFYQNEWAKINLSWVHFMSAAANTTELFCMVSLVNNERFSF